VKKLSRAQRTPLAKLATAAYIEDEEQHLAHHKRHCEICKPPACLSIQEAFLQSISPETIRKKHDLKPRATIYRHAHAFKLFDLRDSTLRLAAATSSSKPQRVSRFKRTLDPASRSAP
jgi:hypothetical protein